MYEDYLEDNLPEEEKNTNEEKDNALNEEQVNPEASAPKSEEDIIADDSLTDNENEMVTDEDIIEENVEEEVEPIITEGRPYISEEIEPEIPYTAQEENEVITYSDNVDKEPSKDLIPIDFDINGIKDKKTRILLWCKKHILLLSLLCLGVILIGILIGAHFFHTRDMVFVRTQEELQKAALDTEGGIIVVKKDITINNDLSLTNYNIDFNGHTITVKGEFCLNANQNIGFGVKKDGLKKSDNSTFKAGGKLVADIFTYTGTESEVTFNCDLVTPAATIIASKANIGGNVSNENDITSLTFYGNNILISGTVAGKVILNGTASLDVFGSATTVEGGYTVRIRTDGYCESISDSQKVYIYPNATISLISGVDNFYIVEQLNAPAALNVVEKNNERYCYIGTVLNADGYTYTIGDITQNVTNPIIKLPNLAPGEYTLKVKAYSNQKDRYLDSAETSIKVIYAVKLSTPTVSIEQSGGTVILRVKDNNGESTKATEYLYTINGTEYKYTVPITEYESRIDITAYTEEMKTYTIYVTARHLEGYYQSSDKTLITFVNQVALATPVIEYEVSGDKTTVEVTWAEVPNSQFYYIEYGDKQLYMKDNSLTIDFVEGMSVSVKAIGKEYYSNSEIATAIITEPVPPTPPEE